MKQTTDITFPSTESEVVTVLEQYNIQNYTINDNLTVDVDGDVDLTYKKLIQLPVKFRNVSGHFYCNDNNITTLQGSPKTVGGDFDCRWNQLTTLEGSPQLVGGGFRLWLESTNSLTRFTSIGWWIFRL